MNPWYVILPTISAFSLVIIIVAIVGELRDMKRRLNLWGDKACCDAKEYMEKYTESHVGKDKEDE